MASEREASMGPRSIDRGIEMCLHSIIGNLSLQWGRDQLIAEFLSPSIVNQSTTWLQWGRDQLIAEFKSSGSSAQRRRRFNGAAIN